MVKLVLAAGGTGGHIWPAISFGQWLRKNKPDVLIEYVCGMRPMELEIYRSAGINPQILSLSGSPLSGDGILKDTQRAFSTVRSLGEAYRILKSASPDCCLLFGGYISLPMLLVSLCTKTPAVMHEQNAYAGKVTRLASKLGADILTGWRECHPLSAGRYTRIGVPVREFERLDKNKAWESLAISTDMPPGPKVLVLTGSLGSQQIKKMVCEIAAADKFKEWVFLLPAVAEKNEKADDNVYLLPKIWDAGLLYSIADMAVIRAGGSTLTEASVTGIPSLVIPWRGAADDHQYHNALAFMAENSAVMWDGCGGTDEFARNLLKLYSIFKGKKKDSPFPKEYNSADRICRDLWLALSSHF